MILAGCGQWPNALSDVLQYNAGSNAWAIVTHLTDARRNQAGTWLGATGKTSMYVLGGYNSNGGSVLQSSEIGPGQAVEVVAAIEAAGGDAEFVRADLESPDDVRALAGRAADVDILVNNAGVFPGGATHELPEATLDETFALT